jgi:hypothetical protein
MNEAPTVDVTDVRKFPQCFSGEFIRLVGVYRIAFENSDLYDPTEVRKRILDWYAKNRSH